MTRRRIDSDITLIPYYRNDEASLPWYQDPDVCKQVDNREEPYDPELLHRMYDYLCSHGACYYIEYKGKLVGDVSLREPIFILLIRRVSACFKRWDFRKQGKNGMNIRWRDEDSTEDAPC